MKKTLRIALGIMLVAMALITAACGGNEGIKIGVVTGTTFEAEAEKFEKVSEVLLYKDDNLTLQELSTGRIDGVITDRLVGLYAIQEAGYSEIKAAGDVLYHETIAVAIRQEDDALRQAINQALADMIADGTYGEISTKYFGKDISEGQTYPETFSDDKTANDNSLEKVKEKGEITFAMSGGYPPFNYFNTDDKLTGFDVEIGEEVANRLGVKYTPITTEWSGILEGLRSGRYDGILGSMAITEERLKTVDFTNPYYLSGAQLFVKNNSQISGPEDLE
ncbi:MAG: transporter substrate-binding domain-containing protein [Dehalobacterium sp.]